MCAPFEGDNKNNLVDVLLIHIILFGLLFKPDSGNPVSFSWIKRWFIALYHVLFRLICSQFNVVLIKGNCEYTVCLKHFTKPFSCLHLTFEGLLSYLKAVNDNSTKSWSQGMNVYVRCNSIATHLSSGKYISKMLLLRMFLIYPIINCF